MKQQYNKIIVLILAICIPILTLFGIISIIPPQYNDSFLAELPDKVELLTKTKEPKLVLIGGSSVAFGYDSELIEKHIDKKVVNFGLYADLGTKLMLDISQKGINKNDVIILGPELNEQTLSLFFNPASTWKAIDSKKSIITQIKLDNIDDMLGGTFNFAKEKINRYNSKNKPFSGLYSHSSFNKFGDISYPRENNIMPLGFDPTMKIKPTAELFNIDFINYINKYIKIAKNKGATVYFTFPPMNKKSIVKISEEQKNELHSYLNKMLDCKLISNIDDCILNSGYFYDTNYHLNDSGVIVNTARLIKDYHKTINSNKKINLELPPPPKANNFENTEIKEDSKNADLFEYKEFSNGLKIVNVKNKANLPKKLVLPQYINGKTILAIDENAISNCPNLEEVTINNNFIQLYDNIFFGSENLVKIKINIDNPEKIMVGNHLLDGTNSNIKIELSEQGFIAYISNYSWSKYSNSMIYS